MQKDPIKEEFDVEKLLKELTLKEKASLCSGEGCWHTKSIKRLNLPPLSLSDGPHGLRKVLNSSEIFKSETSLSTCFPTASALGASWNKTLIYKIGCALGRECNSLGVNILLGPGINMKRTPLCGRNFEYFSEDPYHTAVCATAYIWGVQEQGVGTSLKHFACNNQEYKRFTIDACVDERTLREIYLRAFEMVVHDAWPWTVMSSYNSLNGTLVSENRTLLVDILRKEWGFNGLVVSDWGSIYNRVKALKAGCELQMPGGTDEDAKRIVKAVKSGELDEEYVDAAVASYISLLNKVSAHKKNTTGYNPDEHHALAREAAAESIVLLKNENQILPIRKEKVKSIAIIGRFAGNPHIQGKGSSFVNASKTDIPLEEIKKRAGTGIEVMYADGYAEEDTVYDSLLNQAKEIAGKADVVVVFAGTYHNVDTEGGDRTDINLPYTHNLLVSTLSAVNENIIVLLSNGSAVTMPWYDKVKAILETWLSGQASAGAVADILFGIINPSGKLSESFPLQLEDTPAFIEYPGDGEKVQYTENLYIGYRYYDKRKMRVLFPFGFGLSYTTFEYSGLKVHPGTIQETDTASVRVTIKNTGSVYGREVVQLYIRDIESGISKPEKELKGFEKIGLAPGEEKDVIFILQRDAFTHYDVTKKMWCVEPGEFEILIGSSSRDIRLRQKIQVHLESRKEPMFTTHSYVADFYNNPRAKKLLQEWLNEKTDNRLDLDGLEQGRREAIKSLPLSKAVIFMPEDSSDEELEEIIKKINAELGKPGE